MTDTIRRTLKEVFREILDGWSKLVSMAGPTLNDAENGAVLSAALTSAIHCYGGEKVEETFLANVIEFMWCHIFDVITNGQIMAVAGTYPAPPFTHAVLIYQDTRKSMGLLQRCATGSVHC
jgi:hypothetical protein